MCRRTLLDLVYTHPAFRRWVFDGRVRFYTQTAADFYRDLFPRRDFSNFMARDKGASRATTATPIGVGASYEFNIPWAPWAQKNTLNARIDHITIDYDDFRDATATNPGNGIAAGAEPLFQTQRERFPALPVCLVLIAHACCKLAHTER